MSHNSSAAVNIVSKHISIMNIVNERTQKVGHRNQRQHWAQLSIVPENIHHSSRCEGVVKFCFTQNSAHHCGVFSRDLCQFGWQSVNCSARGQIEPSSPYGNGKRASVAVAHIPTTSAFCSNETLYRPRLHHWNANVAVRCSWRPH